MSLSDSSTAAALAAAQEKIRAAAASIIVEVANTLLWQMKSAATYRERGLIAFAQIHILESRDLFLASFAAALQDSVAADVEARPATPVAGKAETDWQSISLVDEDQIEERISFGRIGQLIAHRCEAELRELDGYMNALLQTGWADPDRNPLRGQILGLALHKAIEKITDEPDTQKIFARELGQAMANAMPACYQAITADLKQRGIRPTDVAMRPTDGFKPRAGARPAGAAGMPPVSDEARKAWELSWQGRIGAENPGPRDWERSILGRHVDPISESGVPESSGRIARPPDARRAAGLVRRSPGRRANGGQRRRGRRADEPAAPAQRRRDPAAASSTR